MNYRQYLCTPRWAELRRQCFERDGGKCRHCGTTERLQAHHIRYPERLGDETVDDLLTLCAGRGGCHQAEERARKRAAYEARLPSVREILAPYLAAKPCMAAQSRSGVRSDSKTSVRGVTAVCSGFFAKIKMNGAQVNLGSFPTLAEASVVYEEAYALRAAWIAEGPTPLATPVAPIKKDRPRRQPPQPKPETIKSMVARQGVKAARSFELADQLFQYDPRTGELFWKLSRSNRIKVGQRAGNTNGMGYAVVGYSYMQCYVHQVVWLLHHRVWPDHEIDHIDGNPLNNRVENLRAASRTGNNCNRGVNRNNKLGIKGVHRALDGRYVAQIMVNRRTIQLGRFATAAEASATYKSAAKRYHGAFVRA